MLFRRITELGLNQPRLLTLVVVSSHSKICPTAKPKVCPGIGRGPSDSSKVKGSPPGGSSTLVRAQTSGPCRLAFIPEEWFQFLHPKTGVSGPYFLMLGLVNYLLSKEIYVMEHEYYTGVSVLIILYVVSTRFGSQIGAYLDKEVDAIHDSYQKSTDEEIAFHEQVIKESQLAQIRAQGQKILMVAKKENIALQLEAIYRERAMIVYRAVRNRMEYHVKRYRAEIRIQHRWMYQWIMDNVNKSITPEFQKQAMQSAIAELAAMSSRAK